MINSSLLFGQIANKYTNNFVHRGVCLDPIIYTDCNICPIYNKRIEPREIIAVAIMKTAKTVVYMCTINGVCIYFVDNFIVFARLQFGTHSLSTWLYDCKKCGDQRQKYANNDRIKIRNHRTAQSNHKNTQNFIYPIPECFDVNLIPIAVMKTKELFISMILIHKVIISNLLIEKLIIDVFYINVLEVLNG